MSTYSLKFEDNGETIQCDAKNDGFSILEMIGMLEVKKDDLMRQLKDKNEFTHKRISVPPDDVLDVIEDASKPKYDHWIDNADSWVCPVCSQEVRDPGKYPGCKCPNCGFQDEKDKEKPNFTFKSVDMRNLLNFKVFCDLNGFSLMSSINNWLKSSPNLNILQITQYAMNGKIFTTVWFTEK